MQNAPIRTIRYQTGHRLHAPELGWRFNREHLQTTAAELRDMPLLRARPRNVHRDGLDEKPHQRGRMPGAAARAERLAEGRGLRSLRSLRAGGRIVIDGLISGRIFGKPEERESRNGNRYVTAKVRTAAGNGDSVFASVISFAPAACDALLALEDGDSVALAGELTPGAWIDRDGNARPSLDVRAHAVLTPYHVRRKREAVASDPSGPDCRSERD